MRMKNLTPHAIVLNDGRVFEPSGQVARVSVEFTEIAGDFCQQVFGDPIGLPEPQADTLLIVSAMVFAATDRKDVIAPATGHPLAKRNEKGHIISVPCFVSKGGVL